MRRAQVIVVARRWDGLGGRLTAILNAWSIARALDLEFRFVWPRNFFTELREPREIFDDSFLARYEVPESSLDSHMVLPAPTAWSLPEARALCRGATQQSMIDIWECFEVLGFVDEPATVSGERFRAGLGEIAWSEVARSLMDCVPCADLPGGYSAVHVRAGDIVEGDWRQFVPVDKFIPTDYVKFAVETLGGRDRDPVVVVSDNDRYVCQLKARFDFVRSPGDLVPGYSSLSESQRALADILVLSRARRVVGPRTSAFSQLAAHAGGLDLLSVVDLMTENEARRRLRDGIARSGKDAVRREVPRPLLARDMCWFLEVFSDDLSVSEYLELARGAVRCEPDYCGALNRLALALAFAGKGRASAEASARALRAADLAEVHADPLVESLATSISARVIIALGARRHGVRQLLGRLGLASRLRGFAGGVDPTVVLDGIEESLERCEALIPFQIHHQDVLDNLRFQSTALAWLLNSDSVSREAARRVIRAAKSEGFLGPSWRPSGFSALRETGVFPQTSRPLELATVRIAQAIGAVLSGTAHCARQGRVETIRTAPSGLRWLAGWAYEPDAGRTDLAVGLSLGDDIVSGGIPHLARPDVAAMLDDPRALNCGFSFPVPLTVEIESGTLDDNLRIYRFFRNPPAEQQKKIDLGESNDRRKRPDFPGFSPSAITTGLGQESC